tara:strand:- start:3552 stop:3866 length:315 start_codon:yes stop_codon:yes gene_type:complete
MNRFIKVFSRGDNMSRKNSWIKIVNNMLAERAMTSREIFEILNQRQRYAPHPRKVTLVLRGNPDFREIDKVSINSLAKTDSHQVSLWGREDREYELSYPYRVRF